mmetsp:Transcript_6025/g.10920  ORF Transcript_6025/g.10920 Transcript_6025/m.10920 type:complete len:297 (-) Transcript_6025:499-1389(-)
MLLFDQLGIGHTQVVCVMDQSTQYTGKLCERIRCNTKGVIMQSRCQVPAFFLVHDIGRGNDTGQKLGYRHRHVTSMLKVVEVVVSMHRRNRANVQPQFTDYILGDDNLAGILLVLMRLSIELGQGNNFNDFTHELLALVDFGFKTIELGIVIALVGDGVSFGNDLLQEFLKDLHIPSDQTLDLGRQRGFNLFQLQPGTMSEFRIVRIHFIDMFLTGSYQPEGMKLSFTLGRDDISTFLDPVFLACLLQEIRSVCGQVDTIALTSSLDTGSGVDGVAEELESTLVTSQYSCCDGTAV